MKTLKARPIRKEPTEVRNSGIARNRMLQLLNLDLAEQYQVVIACIVYSSILRGKQYPDIAQALELHAAEQFQHAMKIVARINDLGGVPCTVKMLSDPPVASRKEPAFVHSPRSQRTAS